MNFAAFASRRRRSLLTLLGLLVAGGVLAAFIMPVSLFPEVRFPRIAVTVDAGDRPADQTEAVITRPVEQAIRAIPGVRDLRSTTSRGEVEISINFGWGSRHGSGAAARPVARSPPPSRPCRPGSPSTFAGRTRPSTPSPPTA